MEKLIVAIVICTYNRPELLMSTLKSAINLDFDPDQFEIIVIDNGNDEQSQEVFASINRESHCQMVYAREEKLGLSYARNKGVSIARGDIVAFLDDDEIVPANWLKELIKPYGTDKRIGGVGGKIIPVFPDNIYPSWYSKEIQGFFGGVDHGEHIHEVAPLEYIGGGNMSFRRQLIIEAGLFNVRLGIVGQSSYSGEENELAGRIRNKGFKVLFNPNAITYHLIERERVSKLFLYRRCYQSGKSETMHNPANSESPWLLLLRFTIALAKSVASYIISTMRSEAARMKAILAIGRSLGKIAGCLKLITHSEGVHK
jgi:glycosyltransferase involved in cell wall biosynthesis